MPPVNTLDLPKQDSNPGIIYSLMMLNEVLTKKNNNTIALAAGLPDNEVTGGISAEMISAAQSLTAPYPKYDPSSKWKESHLWPKMAQFHQEMTGLECDPNHFRFSQGSTPAIYAMIQSLLLNDPQGKLLTISPGYPLYDIPARDMGRATDKSARLKILLDVDEQGNPVAGKWEIDLDSLRNQLENNREHGKVLVLNFPSNPTGYAPEKEKYQEIVEILLEDIKIRKDKGHAQIGILEDMAYASMMHDNKKYYTLGNAIHDMKEACKGIDDEKYQLLEQLEFNSMGVHSFSKAKALAGHRAAYWFTNNPELQSMVYDRFMNVLLTPSITSLAAMNAALEEGQVKPEDMKTYETRLRTLEKGLNQGFLEACSQSKTITPEQKQMGLPVPAAADGGFFASTRFNFLQGLPVEEGFADQIREWAKDIKHDSSRALFQNGNFFEGNRINNATDASLWMLLKANVLTIPLANPSKDDPGITLRFSVGSEPLERVQESVDRIKKALAAPEVVEHIAKFNPKSVQSGYEIRSAAR